MPTVVDALFEDLRAVFLKVREGAGIIVGLDRDVLDADMLLMVLVGDDGRHVELHAVQVELAAAARNFPLHGRAEIVDVELCDLLRILSGLDVDVPELHCHARFLPLRISPRRAGAAPTAAAWQHDHRNSTTIPQTAAVFESRTAPLTGLDNANCRRPHRAHRSGSTSFWARLIGGGYRWVPRSVPTRPWRRLWPPHPPLIVFHEICPCSFRKHSAWHI